MNEKVKLGLNRLNVQALIFFAKLVVTKMTGNTNFPTPVPALADFDAAVDELFTAAENAKVGGPEQTAIKDEKEAAVRSMFNQLGSYIQTESNGNKAIILSAGVMVAEKPEPIGPLPEPRDLVARVSDLKGVIDLDWAPVHGNQLYSVEMNEGDPKDESLWLPVYSTTKSKCSITALEPGHFYYFRVRANGAAGASGASEPAVSVAA